MVIFGPIWMFAGAPICSVVAVAGNRKGAHRQHYQRCVNDINALFRRHELMHSSES
jgi:hypothetical protein